MGEDLRRRGYVLTETDGGGNVTSYTYNALGEVLTTTVRDGWER